MIEVMGLAVLPARLATELEVLRESMLTGADLTADSRTASHAVWAQEVLARHPEFCAEMRNRFSSRRWALCLNRCCAMPAYSPAMQRAARRSGVSCAPEVITHLS
ncbi:MAG: hypothetical protein ACLT2C_01725 [Ruminococcus sp.]